MDPTEADQQLTKYYRLIQRMQKLPVLSKERRQAVKAANEQVPAVNRILAAVAPDIGIVSGRFFGDHVNAIPKLDHALFLLVRCEEMASGQWTGGVPALPFSVLDPMVLQAAMQLWDAGKFRQAVGDAASSVNLFTQKRLDRHDVSDKDLMAQAFSDKAPEQGKPRLRCPGDHRSTAVRSMQQGALLMSQGCFQAIRNPAHHMAGDWNALTAAQHLATLSVVAGWVRHWDIFRFNAQPSSFNAMMQYTKSQDS